MCIPVLEKKAAALKFISITGIQERKGTRHNEIKLKGSMSSLKMFSGNALTLQWEYNICSPNVRRAELRLSNVSGTSRRKMPSVTQPYLLTLQSPYHPQIETCPSADFKAPSF